MATHKSAEKRNKQNSKKNLVNKSTKSNMKGIVKVLKEAVTSGKKEELNSKLKNAQKAIAKTASKGVLHKKTSARYISRLAKLVNKNAE